MDKSYKGALGAGVYKITDTEVLLSAKGKSISFARDDIAEVLVKRSITDTYIPPQKTVRIRLKNKRRYDLKHLKSQDAQEIFQELTR